MVLVAEGTNVADIDLVEPDFAENDRGELRLYLNSMVDDEVLSSLHDDLVSQGVVIEPISQEAHILFIRFQKKIEPLTLIAASIVASGVIMAVLIQWQIIKEPMGWPSWVWPVGFCAIGWIIYKSTRR